MRILVTGTRGIPSIPGGVENHCQWLYPRLAAMGHEVTVCVRSCYATHEGEWEGVRLLSIPCTRSRALEAIIHTFRSLLAARPLRPDVVHIHSIGPMLLTPLARALGFRVVVTNHGPDYQRAKWGPVARTALRLGEYLGARFAHRVICVSDPIAESLAARFGRECAVIPNGVVLPEERPGSDRLPGLGLEPGGYVLCVARFVPEKGLDDLLDAFRGLDTGRKLALVGDADHDTPYARRLKQRAESEPGVVMTGYLSGLDLAQAYANAALFVLPSHHEGLPIALLEALAHGVPCLASDIRANLAVGVKPEHCFAAGNPDELRQAMRRALERGWSDRDRTFYAGLLRERYDWDAIAARTAEVFASCLDKG